MKLVSKERISFLRENERKIENRVKACMRPTIYAAATLCDGRMCEYPNVCSIGKGRSQTVRNVADTLHLTVTISCNSSINRAYSSRRSLCRAGRALLPPSGSATETSETPVDAVLMPSLTLSILFERINDSNISIRIQWIFRFSTYMGLGHPPWPFSKISPIAHSKSRRCITFCTNCNSSTYSSNRKLLH